MTLIELLQELILDFQRQQLPTGVPRQLAYEAVPGKALVCIGPRRAGKSTLLYQIVERLKAGGVKAENILSVNFFDDRLEAVRRGNLAAVTEAYYGLFPEKKGRERVHCFLDEVQMAVGWERFVDRLLRTEKMDVYLTGSSSRLLAREVATEMRGRSLAWELFPFSFREFLAARGVAPDVRGSGARLLVAKTFADFWQTGGFPEALAVSARLRPMLHQEYFQTMLFRDVVERNDALHPQAVRDLAYRLINNVAALHSVNGLTNHLKSLGHKVSKAFVGDCLAWFEDAYCLFSVRLYDASVHRQQVNPKKIYGVDHALVQSVSSGLLVNRGHLLENLVFLHLRRQTPRLHYYRTRSGKEVDFAWLGSDGNLRLAQVADQMPEGSPARDRELGALAEAMAEQPDSRPVVVTRDESGSAELGGRAVRLVPIWRFLIEGDKPV